MRFVSTISTVAAAALLLCGCNDTLPERPVSAPAATDPEQTVGTMEADASSLEEPYIPGTAVIRVSEELAARLESGEADLDAIREELGISRMERVFPYAGEYEERTRREGLHRYWSVDFNPDVTLRQAERTLSATDGVEMFERQVRVESHAYNDPFFSELWGVDVIHAEYAWQYTTGEPGVIVCVVDQGIETDHPDLAWNMSAKDNYNFASKTEEIHGGSHGTHVAGTIAAAGNDGIGVAGIAGGNKAADKHGVTLMSAQVFDGTKNASDFGAAIKWGADHGAVISQNSWGYKYDADDDGKLNDTEKARALADKITETHRKACDYFIKYAGCDNDGNQKAGSPMKGGIVVFSAGNDGITAGHPASYEPLLAVGSVGRSGRISSFSNYGDWVDLSAPGEGIISCTTEGGWASNNGTSMACPHVSGVAALLVSCFGGQGFTSDELIEFLREGANSAFVNTSGRSMGPLVDAKGSFDYAFAKRKRENNRAPVFRVEYDGDWRFHQWENVEITIHVSDPDGDTVKLEQEIEGRASLTKANDSTYVFKLLCELVSNFTPQKMTLTAKDSFGGVETLEVSYSVMRNNAPEAASAPQDRLCRIGESFTLDLGPLFTDKDEEPLDHIASVSPSGCASATVSGTTLSVKPQSEGLATITVTASDHMGEKATQSFKVLVRREDSDVECYPNPVKDKLYIRTGLEEEKVSYSLTSPTGATVRSGKVTCSAFNPGTIDMRPFAPGVYSLSLRIGGKERRISVVKI